MKKFKNIILKVFIVACMSLVCFFSASVSADTTGAHAGSGGTREGSSYSSSSASETGTSGSGSGSSSSSTGDLKPDDYEPKNGDIDSLVVERYSARIFNFLYVIAVIVTIIMIMYVGLKYITGSVSEKAEYKKNLVPIAIGALLITFLATIIRIIFSIAGSI